MVSQKCAVFIGPLCTIDPEGVCAAVVRAGLYVPSRAATISHLRSINETGPIRT